MASHVINIHATGHEINLTSGKHKIDVLGGWGVKLRQFSISLTNIRTGQRVDCKRSFWPAQSFAFGKRTRRIFTFHISESDTYRIEFTHPMTIEVKESSLFITSLFQKPLPNEHLTIYIH